MDRVCVDQDPAGESAAAPGAALDPLLQVLNRMGCGGIVLDEAGQVLDSNAAAKALLFEETSQEGGAATPEETRSALKGLLRAGGTRFTLESDAWALVQRPDRRPIVLHAVPLGAGHLPGPHTMVVLIDLDEAPQANVTSLQRIFGLTPAEARIAVQITRGETLSDIAAGIGVSMATARKQLACVFQKTRTHRQAELVALLARVSILP